LNGLTFAKYGNVIVSLISAFFIALIFISVINRYLIKGEMSGNEK
jgi:hypothetical protein